MKLINNGINPRFKYNFAVMLDKVVVSKRSAARPRTANWSILNLAKTGQMLTGGLMAEAAYFFYAIQTKLPTARRRKDSSKMFSIFGLNR